MADRDQNELVPLMLRIREDLRQDLEQSAKARRVSLNQECIDRLAYVRDRKSLLAEVLRLTFGERLAGLLLAVGLAMAGVANRHRRGRRFAGGAEVRLPTDWIDDPATFGQAVEAANTVLKAAQPEGEKARVSPMGRFRAHQLIAAVGGKAQYIPTLMPELLAREVEAIKELLGPVAQRMTPALHVRDALASRIAAGEWKPHAAIPGESDLAHEYDVSPETMRKALDLMEGEGLLTRRPTLEGSDEDNE